MTSRQLYDPTLPRTIAVLVHTHGFKNVIGELAAYCEAEWIQAEIRNEPATHWRHAGQTLAGLIQGIPAIDEME